MSQSVQPRTKQRRRNHQEPANHYSCSYRSGCTTRAQGENSTQDVVQLSRPMHGRPAAETNRVVRVRLNIIGNLETMHDSDLPTFFIISLPTIFKRTVACALLSLSLSLSRTVQLYSYASRKPGDRQERSPGHYQSRVVICETVHPVRWYCTRERTYTGALQSECQWHSKLCIDVLILMINLASSRTH